MGWYCIDAIDPAIKKAKQSLIEPFDFWKWIRLAIIIIFVGGQSIPDYNLGDGYQRGSVDETIDGPSTPKSPDPQEIFDQMKQVWEKYRTYILIAIAVLILIFLLFSLISSIMEFVFIESLVTNKVAIRAYFGKFMRRGFNLFIIQSILGILFLSIFLALLIPVLQSFISSPEIITADRIIGSFIWLFIVFILLAIAAGIIQSFIHLSIPVSIYQETGLIDAIKKVLGRFRADWKQIPVYWVVRFVIGLAAGITVLIVALIIFLVMLLLIIVVGALLYGILLLLGSGIGSPMFWLVMIPYAIIVSIPILLFLLLAAVPVPVFMKYHMMIFLRMWYPDVRIPFFDDSTGTSA